MIAKKKRKIAIKNSKDHGVSLEKFNGYFKTLKSINWLAVEEEYVHLLEICRKSQN